MGGPPAAYRQAAWAWLPAWDCTLGYPGEGPRHRKKVAKAKKEHKSAHEPSHGFPRLVVVGPKRRVLRRVTLPRGADDREEFPVREIVHETAGGMLEVAWDGVDPKGLPWPNSWVRRSDCTPALLREWAVSKDAKYVRPLGVAHAVAAPTLRLVWSAWSVQAAIVAPLSCHCRCPPEAQRSCEGQDSGGQAQSRSSNC